MDIYSEPETSSLSHCHRAVLTRNVGPVRESITKCNPSRTKPALHSQLSGQQLPAGSAYSLRAVPLAAGGTLRGSPPAAHRAPGRLRTPPHSPLCRCGCGLPASEVLPSLSSDGRRFPLSTLTAPDSGDTPPQPASRPERCSSSRHPPPPAPLSPPSRPREAPCHPLTSRRQPSAPHPPAPQPSLPFFLF